MAHQLFSYFVLFYLDRLFFSFDFHVFDRYRCWCYFEDDSLTLNPKIHFFLILLQHIFNFFNSYKIYKVSTLLFFDILVSFNLYHFWTTFMTEYIALPFAVRFYCFFYLRPPVYIYDVMFDITCPYIITTYIISVCIKRGYVYYHGLVKIVVNNIKWV